MSSVAEGAVLLALARAAIESELGRSTKVAASADWLRDPGATFVTLRQAEKLRGCIGTLQAHRPLVEDVTANALAAAFRDPRFKPLTRDELDMTKVEVSLLSPLAPITFDDEASAMLQLKPGVDGLVFEYGYHKSTFLPQVWEDITDPSEFLSTLRQKAGLPPDFWDRDVKLARYTVSKWSE